MLWLSLAPRRGCGQNNENHQLHQRRFKYGAVPVVVFFSCFYRDHPIQNFRQLAPLKRTFNGNITFYQNTAVLFCCIFLCVQTAYTHPDESVLYEGVFTDRLVLSGGPVFLAEWKQNKGLTHNTQLNGGFLWNNSCCWCCCNG